MSEKELLEKYKLQISNAQFYLKRYVEELKLHFGLNDFHILKIFENEIKILKAKNTVSVWFNFLKKF